MNIYEKIDYVLKEKNMSRRKLAELAGIPPTSLQSAFSRKSDSMSTDMLKKIVNALDIDVIELIQIQSEEEELKEIKKELELEKIDKEMDLASDINDKSMFVNAYLKKLCKIVDLPDEAATDFIIFYDFMEYKYSAKEKTQNAKENKH